MAQDFHEQFSSEAMKLPSDRSTGLVFTVVALIIAYLWRSNPSTVTIAMSIAAIFLLTSLIAPHLLRPLNKAWFKLSLLLNRVMSPVIMLVLFSVMIVPFGLVMQFFRDPLHKRRNSAAKSYWIEQEQSPVARSMTNQF